MRARFGLAFGLTAPSEGTVRTIATNDIAVDTIDMESELVSFSIQ